MISKQHISRQYSATGNPRRLASDRTLPPSAGSNRMVMRSSLWAMMFVLPAVLTRSHGRHYTLLAAIRDIKKDAPPSHAGCRRAVVSVDRLYGFERFILQSDQIGIAIADGIHPMAPSHAARPLARLGPPPRRERTACPGDRCLLYQSLPLSVCREDNAALRCPQRGRARLTLLFAE